MSLVNALPKSLQRFVPGAGASGEQDAPQPVETAFPAALSDVASDAAAPLGLRLRAWWEGMSIAELAAAEARRAAANGTAEADPAAQGQPVPIERVGDDAALEEVFDPTVWSPSRIAVNEMLFGSGEVLPGGVARTLDLIGSFGLGQDVNVLQIGAGLGGPARAIALEYQGWVTGFEGDADLAAAAMAPERVDIAVNDGGSGMRKSKIKVKLADKARIEHADLDALQVKQRVYDCAFAREMMHLIADKARLLRAVHGGLKAQGALMISDYFVVDGHAGSSEVLRWVAEGDGRIHPWTLAEAKALLKQLGYDLRVIKDITAEHRADILRSFGNFVLAHHRGSIPGDLIQPLLHLTERWCHRVAMLDAGAVQVYKLQAFKMGD